MKTLHLHDIIVMVIQLRKKKTGVYINFEGRGEGQKDMKKVYAFILAAIAVVLLLVFYFLFKYTTSHVYIKEASEDRAVLEDACIDTTLDEEKFKKADEKFKMKIDDTGFIRAQVEYFMPVEKKDKLDKNFKKSYNKVFEEEYLFNGDAKLMPQKLLQSLSRNEIKLVLAEILARHGYDFKTKEFKAYFNQKSWYKVDDHFNVNFLSTTEKQNIKYIMNYENELDKK